MIKYSKAELIDMISNYDDTMAISKMLGDTVDMLEELDIEGEHAYYLKEARSNLEGMYGLLMDLKKDHLTNVNLQTPQD